MKSLMEVAADVERQRRATTIEEDDVVASSLSTYNFTQTYKGDLSDDDDLVVSVQGGLSGADSPWPLTDLYHWFQNIGAARGTLVIKASFTAEEPSDDS